MQIEAGKYYKTRDGRKVGPMVKWNDGTTHDWSDHKTSGSSIWDDYGNASIIHPHLDLISEWQDDTTESPHVELAELATKYGIRITVSTADADITYDGRYGD